MLHECFPLKTCLETKWLRETYVKRKIVCWEHHSLGLGDNDIIRSRVSRKNGHGYNVGRIVRILGAQADELVC
jgi:hypothetical protein